MRFLIILFLCCGCVSSWAQVSIIETIAGTGVQGYGGDGGPATNAKFDHANQLCLDNFGNLYISDAFNNRIRKIALSTGIITTVAGNGTGGFGGDNGQATDAQLWIPQAICTDNSGNLYIGDAINKRVRKVVISTGIITTLVGNGIAGNSGDGAQATDAEINMPGSVFVDKYGNLFMTDVLNNNVRKITPDGIISTIAGDGSSGFAGNGGFAIHAQLNVPGRVVVDNFGDIIISDNRNHDIRKVDAITGIITTIAGDGTPGYSGDGGPASNAQLQNPYGLFINTQNDIFIVESGNGVVRKTDGVTGIISTVVGCGVLGFDGDGGPATDAKLRPDDVVIDSFGTMYITDYQNNRIRRVYNPQLTTHQITANRNEVIVYPNPAKDEVTIEYRFNSHEDAKLVITDMAGRVIVDQELSRGREKEVVDISSLSAGLYMYKVIQGKEMITVGKVVKE